MKARFNAIRHMLKTLDFIKTKKDVLNRKTVTLNGNFLSIPMLYGLVWTNNRRPKLELCGISRERMKLNSDYLSKKVCTLSKLI